MTDYRLWQIDAFADRVFAGNPAAVVPLDTWPADALLQDIAAENNLAETAFFVPEGDGFHLRWFTPTVEMDLCGHATLASAWLLFNVLHPGRRHVAFRTLSGALTVTSDGDWLMLDFPARPAVPTTAPAELVAALGGVPPREALKANFWLLVYADAATVRGMQPDFGALARVPPGCVIVTAPGEHGHDFVSRFFAPGVGIDEDPVTGGAHCTLVPYWAARLGRSDLMAFQASRRGGVLRCTAAGDRVRMAGTARLYLEGMIHV